MEEKARRIHRMKKTERTSSGQRTENSEEIYQSSNIQKVVSKEMHALFTKGYVLYIHIMYAKSVIYPPADLLYY